MRRVKHSVAVMIVRDREVLSTKRPLTDDELPGIWGLPAGTIRGSETIADVIARIGSEKLGVTLMPVKRLGVGVQDRPEYRLEMELWEATMLGLPKYSEWRWASLESLEPGVSAGSLCCQLAIQTKSRVS